MIHSNRFRLLAVLAMLVVVPLAIYSTLNRGVAATVNGHSIYRAEIEAPLALLAKKNPERFSGPGGRKEAANIRKSILRELIEIKVAGQAARRAGIKVTKAEADGAMRRVRAVYRDDDTFAKALSDQGISEKMLGIKLRDQLAADKMRRRFASASSRADADRAPSAARLYAAWLKAERDRASVVTYGY